MKTYSPTALNIFDRNCPSALEHYIAMRQSAVLNEKEYEVEGPEMAEIGIVFHECVYAAAHARKKDETPWGPMEATAIQLTKKIPPARVKAGYDMAKEFVTWWEFPVALNFEHGVAFDPQWRQVEWDSPARRIRLRFDACGCETIDHPVYGEITVARGQDYKTGWGANESELDSIQFDLYTVALKQMYPDAEGIQIECIATRFTRTYSKLLVFGDEADDLELANRKKNVEFWMNSADVSDGKPRVGPGCMRCNFVGQCVAFQDRAKSLLTTPDIAREPIEAARDFGVLEARMKQLKEYLQEAVSIKPIELDGEKLGYHTSKKRALKEPTSPLKLWLEANKIELSEEQQSVINGLFLVMEPGVTQMDKVIKKVAKTIGYRTQKEAIEAEGKKVYDSNNVPRFGWKAEDMESDRKGEK